MPGARGAGTGRGHTQAVGQGLADEDPGTVTNASPRSLLALPVFGRGVTLELGVGSAKWERKYGSGTVFGPMLGSWVCTLGVFLRVA